MNDNDKENNNSMQEKPRRGRPPASEASKFIAFRVDIGTAKKIEHLENLTGNKKTDVIINAIDNSYSQILLGKTFDSMRPIIREIFPKAEIVFCRPSMHNLELEEEVKIQTNRLTIILHLSKGLCKSHGVDLNHLFVKLKIEGEKTVRIEIEAPITDEQPNKISNDFLKRVFDIASRCGIEMKTKNYGRDHLLEFAAEIMAYPDYDWKTQTRKKLRSIEKAISEVSAKKNSGGVMLSCEKKDKPDTPA